MIWKEQFIYDIEEEVLNREEGPISFIVSLSESQQGIVSWLVSEEHSYLEDSDYNVLVYLVEVIFKSADPQLIGELGEIDGNDLSEIEDDLWAYDNKHKKLPIDDRYLDREICRQEPALASFIGEVIEDYREESEIKPLIQSILWIAALTIAEGVIENLEMN